MCVRISHARRRRWGVFTGRRRGRLLRVGGAAGDGAEVLASGTAKKGTSFGSAAATEVEPSILATFPVDEAIDRGGEGGGARDSEGGADDVDDKGLWGRAVARRRRVNRGRFVLCGSICPFGPRTGSLIPR